MPEPQSIRESDSHQCKRHNVYGPGWVMEGIDKLAEFNAAHGRKGQNRSQIIINELKKYLRVHAPTIRKMGFRLPDELWRKEKQGGWRKPRLDECS